MINMINMCPGKQWSTRCRANSGRVNARGVWCPGGGQNMYYLRESTLSDYEHMCSIMLIFKLSNLFPITHTYLLTIIPRILVFYKTGSSTQLLFLRWTSFNRTLPAIDFGDEIWACTRGARFSIHDAYQITISHVSGCFLVKTCICRSIRHVVSQQHLVSGLLVY